ncbi:MAG: LytR/AlgR family response regulator transcription factor [Clostridium sp.]
MIKIFMCDDNETQLNKFKKMVEDTIDIECIDGEISLATTNPNDIINKVSMGKREGSGIYLLDVNLKSDINGIQLAEKIREYDPRAFIIFITTHAEMSYITFLYRVEAMDYIIKDNYASVKARLHKCLVDANKRYNVDNENKVDVFTVSVGERTINVYESEIVCFETSSTAHKIILQTVDRRIEFYGKLRDLECKLGEDFYRSHKSFIVNKKLIKEVDYLTNIIHMINGYECMGSNRLIKGIKL